MLKYILSLIIFLVLDLLWLNVYMKKRFSNLVQNIQRSPMKIKTPGLLAYVLIAFGIGYFGVKQNIPDSVKNGLLVGLIMYGVFDLTNFAIFDGYDINTVVIDMTWGILASGLTSALVSVGLKKLKNI